ncbi:hypothetical protein D9M72_376780 [compost metagenome]
MIAVGSQHPQVVFAAVGIDVPRIVQRLAGFDHVAARNAVEVQLVIDVEQRAGLLGAGVGEQQAHCLGCGIDACTGMQFIWQLARRTRAGVLLRQRGRGRHRDRRLGLLPGGQAGGVGTGGAAGQRGQGLGVGRGKVESAGQVAADGTAVGADLRLHHAEARLQEAQHRGVVEHFRVDPAAAAPRRHHPHRHARAGAEGLAVLRRLLGRGGLEVEVLVRHLRVVEGRLAGQRAVQVARRRGRRRAVVEEAVVLVEVDQQHGLAPDLGRCRQRVQDSLHVPAALGRAGRAGVLAELGRRDDPRHLGQLAVEHVVTQRLQEAAVGHGVAEALGQRAVLVVDVRVVGRVDAGAGGVGELAPDGHLLHLCAPVPEAHHLVAAIVVRHVLVDLPAHAGSLQAVGVGLPGPAFGGGANIGARVELIDHHGDVVAGGTVAAGPVEQAVGDGAGVHRAVVGIAQREGVSQRALERDLGVIVVAHRQRLLGHRPAVHAAVVPRGLRVGPGVRRAAGALRVALGFVEMVGRQQIAVGIGLVERVLAIGQRDREAVAVAAHALEGAEVVVERAVLQHHHHDVLDVLDGASGVVGLDGERAADAGRKAGQHRGGGAGAEAGLQELSL